MHSHRTCNSNSPRPEAARAIDQGLCGRRACYRINAPTKTAQVGTSPAVRGRRCGMCAGRHPELSQRSEARSAQAAPEAYVEAPRLELIDERFRRLVACTVTGVIRAWLACGPHVQPHVLHCMLRGHAWPLNSCSWEHMQGSVHACARRRAPCSACLSALDHEACGAALPSHACWRRTPRAASATHRPAHCIRARMPSRCAFAAPSSPRHLRVHACMPACPHCSADYSEVFQWEARQAFASCIAGGEPRMRLSEAALHISAEDDAVGGWVGARRGGGGAPLWRWPVDAVCPLCPTAICPSPMHVAQRPALPLPDACCTYVVVRAQHPTRPWPSQCHPLWTASQRSSRS